MRTGLAADAAELGRLVGGEAVGATRLAGGSLAEVLLVERGDGRRFVVKHSPDAPAEAAMLAALGAAGAPVPEASVPAADRLVLSHVANDGRIDAAWEDIGRRLKQVHATLGARYGYAHDGAFGSVAIANGETASWHEFWSERRLLCHAGHVDGGLARRIEAIAARLGEWIPDDPPPALLHGDLWGGNMLVDSGRLAALIDPACYFGDGEVDLAMLTLFDSPGSAFWNAYGAPRPGWEERRAVYQLWPALVHLRLFGDGYLPMVSRLIDRLS